MINQPLCKAHNARTGNPCRNRAILGGTVCVNHGGRTRHVKAKAAERVAFAEALARNPRRDRREILRDLLHTVDVLQRQMTDTIGAKGVDAFALVESLNSVIDRAQRLAAQISLDDDQWDGPDGYLRQEVIEEFGRRLDRDIERQGRALAVQHELAARPAPLALPGGVIEGDVGWP